MNATARLPWLPGFPVSVSATAMALTLTLTLTAGLAGSALSAGCAAPDLSKVPADPLVQSFEADVQFLSSYAPVEILEIPGEGRIAVSAEYQGRVMTSAFGPGGTSLGYVNHKFIAEGKTGTAFDNFGGEDRFWLAPEGGQFALYFPVGPDASLTREEWRVPAEFGKGAWDMRRERDGTISFRRNFTVTNRSGASFEVGVHRKVRLLHLGDLATRYGVVMPAGAKFVGFESVNTITNIGDKSWTPATGLPAIWSAGMFPPRPGSFAAIPFHKDPAEGVFVNTKYFAEPPADRFSWRREDGFGLMKLDGLFEAKIGAPRDRTTGMLASYGLLPDGAGLLTVVATTIPGGKPGYTNNSWESVQADPFGGDAVNIYNAGPVIIPNKENPDLPPTIIPGGFYELETLSAAAQLNPGESIHHTHTTIHFTGEPGHLDYIGRKVVGIPAGRLAAGVR
jgi:hypothetical protein